MNNRLSRRSAFTLIELLVVIAIIAILAAILFPVFAQAKESAKNSAFLSNHKQTGLGCLMYCADYDDLFPLSWLSTDTNGSWTWQGQIQPYTKNWGVLLNPKIQPPTGAQAYWQRVLHLGSLPRVQAVHATATFYQSDWRGLGMTKSDGIMGSSGGGYGFRPASSLSQTSIADVANSVLVSESGQFDYWVGIYGATNPFTFCADWGAGWSPWGASVISGPSTTTRPTTKAASGVAGCAYPNGRSTYVAADGSAKSQDFRGQVMKKIQLGDGTMAFEKFWPNGN